MVRTPLGLPRKAQVRDLRTAVRPLEAGPIVYQLSTHLPKDDSDRSQQQAERKKQEATSLEAETTGCGFGDGVVQRYLKCLALAVMPQVRIRPGVLLIVDAPVNFRDLIC